MRNKNGQGGIMLSLLFFIMSLGVMVVFISPINSFLDLAQQSDALNCRGYLDNGLNETYSSLAFNSTKDGGASGSPMACLALKLYLPYLLLVFLIAGLSSVLAGKTADWFGFSESSPTGY